jgi:hypothetical protein
VAEGHRPATSHQPTLCSPCDAHAKHRSPGGQGGGTPIRFPASRSGRVLCQWTQPRSDEMTHRQLWLSNGSIEREAVVSALTLDCPYCGEALGPLAGQSFRPGRACVCGAEICREAPGLRWPSSPRELRQAFREIRERLQRVVVGHDLPVAQLALMGAQHLHGFGSQRGLLIGPSGSGKTTLGTTLAEALGCPVAVWDVGTSAEVGWHGVDVADILADLYDACDSDVQALSSAVLVLDEVDKLATCGAAGSARDHRLGQQKSILALLGGGTPIRFHREHDRGPTVSLLTERMMILGLGCFEGLPHEAGPGDLVRYGYMTELSSRWSVIIRLERLTDRALRMILAQNAQDALAAANACGYVIRVSPEALGYAAAAVLRGGDEVTPRAAIGWLRSAIDRLLVRLLDLDAPADEIYEIRGDDLQIPPSLGVGDVHRP